MSRFSQGFFSFLFGIMVGSLGALLMAKETGPQTRSKLSFILDRYIKMFQKFIHSLLHEQAAVENQAKKQGNAVLEYAKEQAEALLHDVDNLIDKIKKQ